MSDAKLQHERSMALTVAGFDPSGGAGVLADVRAMEAVGVLGQAAVTGQTVQTDLWLYQVQWHLDTCLEQLSALLDRSVFGAVKVGILPNLAALDRILDCIEKKQPDLPVVWDPIFAPSGGEPLMPAPDPLHLLTVLPRLALLTPNLHEYKLLKDRSPSLLSACPVFLKGGHAEGGATSDQLLTETDSVDFPAERLEAASKHGSGCTVSAFITAFLASGYSLEGACRRASERMPAFLKSSQTQLGVHGPWPAPGQVYRGASS
jgi:hydroxymethylpyrimidine/phosphomethylpyrimidine kinase